MAAARRNLLKAASAATVGTLAGCASTPPAGGSARALFAVAATTVPVAGSQVV